MESVSELLSQAVGVHVAQYGASVRSARLAARRGAGTGLDLPRRCAAHLGGHGVVSLGDLPATAIERVEIFRGWDRWASRGDPGGAINLVTVSAPGLRELHVSRGSFGTWEGRGTSGFGAARSVCSCTRATRLGRRLRFWDDNATSFNLATTA